MVPTRCTRALAGPLLAVAAVLAAAAPARPGEKSVEVVVVAILATDRNAEVHPKLRELAAEVQRHEPRLTGYRFGRMTCRRVTVGNPENFKLVEGKQAVVTVHRGPGKDGRCEVSVASPLTGEIVYASCSAKYFPIITGYQTKKKERLIVAVMFQPCPGKRK